MAKVKEQLKKTIKEISEEFLKKTEQKDIFIVSHFDTDGITSAAIASKALKMLDKRFVVKIVKSIEKEFIYSMPKNKVILFLDLASGSLDYLNNSVLEDIFIIDHHEVSQEIPKNVKILNSWLHEKEKISSSGLTYLFFKELVKDFDDALRLAIVGMVGDFLDKEISKIIEKNQSNLKIIRGLLIYPATRPINKVLEYCSHPYIPGVTGNPEGVLELLREARIEPSNGKYKSLIEFNEDEMKKIVTSIMLRNPKATKEIIGDIFLTKFFNKLEDAREISAIINACSRLGNSALALKFCMEVPQAKKEAEEIYMRYKQSLISALDFVSKTERIKGKKFVIINAKNNVADTIIGTIASILSNSSDYEEGTIVVTMAYYDDKIKVSARICGRNNNENNNGTRNVRELLESVVKEIGGEAGGHEFAAGCIISKKSEKQFIELLKKNLEIEVIKI